MTYPPFLLKFRITYLALKGSVIFALLCLSLSFIDGALVFPLLYIPGAIFGITMAMALKEYSDKTELIIFFSTIEYIAIIFFCSKDYEYLAVRRLLMGGLGAALFLATISVTTTIKLKVYDFIAGFVAGIVTTMFIWTDNYSSFDPWLMVVSIILWQTAIATIINLRLSDISKNTIRE